MLKHDRAINQINRNVTPAPEKAIALQQTAAQNQPTVTQASSVPSDATAKVEEPTKESRVAAFINRAQQYISKGEYDRAIQELKDALKIDPNHGIAHAVMGRAYLHKSQLTMAKVHIGKAYEAEPHNQIVIESKNALDKLAKTANKSKTSNPGSMPNAAQNNKPANSSFFSGFFGTKKK